VKEIETTLTIDVKSSDENCQAVSTEKCNNDNYSHSIITQTAEIINPPTIDISDDDDDDEFGGGSFDVVAYLAAKASDGENDESGGNGGNGGGNGQNTTADGDDEDDEFGGGSFNVEAYHTALKVVDDISVSKPRKSGIKSRKTVVAGDGVQRFNHPLICEPIAPNGYLVNKGKMTDSFDGKKDITIPMVADTEFFTPQLGNYHQQSRKLLTTQLKGIHKDAPEMMYAQHPAVNEGRKLARLKPCLKAITMFHPLDYLRDVGGVEVSVREAKPSEIGLFQKCHIPLIAHFATAEILLIALETIKQRIKQLIRNKGEEQITAGRRVFCQHKTPDFTSDTVSMKHIVSLNGIEYELCLKVIDTGAIHGIAGYAAIAKAVGFPLKYKDNFNSEEKGRMLDMVIERAKDFEEYALGDLGVYDILEKFDEQWRLVYKKLGLTPYYREPKLTIGGTVKDLFEAALANYFRVDSKKWNDTLKEIINNFIQPGSADELRKWTNFTRAILSKVEGGRCRNNRPTELAFKSQPNSLGLWENLICDIDISGCYGEGQRNQNYPIGKPEIFDYKQSKNNDYISLRKWLISYGVQIDTLVKSAESRDSAGWNSQENWGELLSGLWQARMSNLAPLKYSQDFFASWFLESSYGVDMLAKSLKDMKCDSEMISTENVDFDEDMGSLKVFNNDIKNGVLTHDGLQWILSVASKRQRNELLDNLAITSSAVYCASYRIDVKYDKDGLEKLTEKTNNWTGKNTTQRIKNESGNTSIVMDFREYHGWFSVNLGTLLVDNLLIERKKAKIQYGEKSPLDVLFKLCVNTLYGDMVSKFFVTSNPVVGNNITARARALAWYMEKGLHGHQPITDGCAFELNGVLFPRSININGECVNLHREDSKLTQKNIKKGSLGGEPILCKWIDGKPYLIIDGVEIENSSQWIDKMAMVHLQNTFNLVDVLHRPSESLNVDKKTLEVKRLPRIGQFSFETKELYHSGCFHGSANYLLESPNGQVIKARGYETKREHTGIELDLEQDGVEFVKSERYGTKNNPAKDLMKQLLDHPESIKRQNVALKSGILKLGDYKNLSEKYDELGIEPGDNILKPVLMQEFSLSQFTFKTYEQYVSWKKVIEKAKMKQKQSLEGYFLNEDLTLNLQALCDWIDKAIASGEMNPFDELKDKNRNDRRTEKTVKAQTRKTETRGKQLKRAVAIDHPHLETLISIKAQLNNPPD